jgi:hypothetical protein
MLKEKWKPPILIGLGLVLGWLVAVALLLPSQPQKESHRHGASNEDAPWPPPWWLTWDAPLTFFTGGLFLYAFLQFGESRKSSERQLRAYVFPRAEELRDYGVGKTAYLYVKITNLGQTPAYKFKQAARGGYRNFPLTEPIPHTQDMEPESAPLGPGDFVYAKAKIMHPLTQAHLNEIKAGKKALYFVGQIDFVDAFGKPRWVKYCFASGGSDDFPLGIVRRYKRGNSTSEDESL